MFTAWLAEKFIGSGEWQLRAQNILWGTAALAAMAYSGRRLRMPWLPLLMVIQPFLWFYMSESRHYVLHLAAGAWLLASLITIIQCAGSGWVWAAIFGGAALALSYGTMLAPITIGSFILFGAALAIRNGWRIQKKAAAIVVVAGLLCLPAAFHYRQTLARDAKGAELWKVGPTYLPYVFYELTGLNGLGPGTADLRVIARERDVGSIVARHKGEVGGVLVMAVAAAVVLGLGAIALRTRTPDPAVLPLLCVFGSVLLLLTAASYVAQKPFWGRHYAAVFPIYTAVLGFGIREGLEAGRWRIFPVAVAAFLTLLACSSLCLRISQRHRKEDYRTASAVARKALESGESVWWIAAPEAAEYYGLPLIHESPVPGHALSPVSKVRLETPAPVLRQLPRPELIVMSRPDAFDPSGEAHRIVQEEGYYLAGGAHHFYFYRH
jgi:hypothetical protein